MYIIYVFQFHILTSVYVMMFFIFQDRIVHFLIETVYNLAPLEFESTQVGFGQMWVGANSNLVPDSMQFVGLSVFDCLAIVK